MNGKKCFLILLLVAVLSMSLVFLGCGKEVTNSGEESTENTDQEKILIRLGHIVPDGSPLDVGSDKFKELVEERSNGRIEVQVFPNAALGNEGDMCDGVQMGSLEMVAAGDGPIDFFVPEYGAICMPFTFRDQAHLDAVTSGPIGEEINQALIKAKGIRVLSWWPNGPRNIIANKAIYTPDDLKGVKIRVPEMATYVKAFTALGALATPITWSELYTALQQGVVDGAEQPLGDIVAGSFHETCKYIMNTEHVFYPNMILISEKLFQSLPEDLKEVIVTSAEDARIFSLDYLAKEEGNFAKTIKEAGVQFIEVDKQLFLDKIQGVPQELEKELNWKPGLWQQIVDTK
jgi:tripartite ATP-independent transporter DctP family solute receptor